MQAWKSNYDHVDWKYPNNQTLRFYRPQMFAILQVTANITKKSGVAAREQVIQDTFSNRNMTIDWMDQTLVQRYVEAYAGWIEQQQQKAADPQSPQASLIGPDGQPTAAVAKQQPQQGELFKEDNWHGNSNDWHAGDNAWSSERHEMVETDWDDEDEDAIPPSPIVESAPTTSISPSAPPSPPVPE
jgi:hypothetical protein